MQTITIRTTPEGEAEVVVSKIGDAYRVDALGWVTAIVDGSGALISLELRDGVHPLDAEEIVDRSIRPRLGQLLGRPNLHASAVAIAGRAIGFHGRSGAGKSTLATLMVEHGAQLLSDDALALEPQGDEHLALPTAHETQLRDGTATAVKDRLGDGVRGLDKCAFALPVATEPAPLRRLYVLSEDAGDLRLSPMTKLEAVAEIASNLHRLDPTDPVLLAKELDFLQALVAHVPVLRLRHPRDFEKRDELIDFLLADLERAP